MRPDRMLLAWGFAGLLVIILGGAPMAYGVDGAAPSRESAEMARMRQEAKWRQRRLIFNNDGNDISSGPHENPERFLSDRIVPALGTQVDTVFYCTGVSTLFQHDTNVAERFDDLQEQMNFKHLRPINRHANMRMLRKAGCDALSLVTQRVHEAGLEVFWTHRINDIHDSFTDSVLCNWKRENPQYMMGTPEDIKRYEVTDPRHMWSTLDFEKPEVLDYLYRITEEVCQRYDVDGVELDYFRHPLFFRPNLEYKPATPAQVEIMTNFQRRLREMAYREGSRRGRPILVATHVPMSRERCLHVGIDLERWLRDDLVDILVIGSGYQPLSMPSGDLAEFGHVHDVPVYPNISASGMRQWGKRIEPWRAAASNIWQAGADGINLFNWFPADSFEQDTFSFPDQAQGTDAEVEKKHPILMTLGDPKTLAGLDKVFGIDNAKEDYGCLEQGVVQSQILPVALDSAGKPREVNLPVGDDIAAAAANGNLKSATLRVQFVSRVPGDNVELVFNGEVVAPKSEVSEDGWVTYRPGQYRVGDNTLSFRVTAGDPAREKELSVRSVELHVAYR
jgi:hypothetical protein